MVSRALAPYIALIESFLDGRSSPLTFEREYLEKFKGDGTDWPEAEYEVLNELFSDVDAFCADLELRDPGDLDEEQLKQRARKALERLSALE